MYENSEELKTFTLSEARSLLPRVRKLMGRLMTAYAAMERLRDDIERARQQAESNGGSRFGTEYLTRLGVFTQALQQIQTLGVEIKDLQKGLVDFPYEYEGRIIYLCWRVGEEEIAWWHETDAGFIGRKLITDEFE